MTDSAPDASMSDATEPKPINVLEQFAQFAHDNPDILAYQVRTEQQAEAILMALVPALRATCAQIMDRSFRMEVLGMANQMEQAINRSRCFNYISKRVGVDAICLSGIRIVAKKA